VASDRRLTRESARAAGACYSDERIACLVPLLGLSPAQVARLPIPHGDRHWALVMACGANQRTLREHAVWCARQALSLVQDTDSRSVAVCDVAARHARGEATDGELAAAGAAARAAARAAAWDAAGAAARAAAGAAARAAAGAAARAAARAAAWDAAGAAARAAAWAAAWDAAGAAAGAAARDAAGAAQLADLAARLEAQDG